MITNSIPIPLTYLPNKSWLEREEYKMGAEKEKYLSAGNWKERKTRLCIYSDKSKVELGLDLAIRPVILFNLK